jgi:hypothetical protein
MYYRLSHARTYFLLSPHDLLEEEDVDGVNLGQVGLILQHEEVVELLLALELLHDLMDVDLSKALG